MTYKSVFKLSTGGKGKQKETEQTCLQSQWEHIAATWLCPVKLLVLAGPHTAWNCANDLTLSQLLTSPRNWKNEADAPRRRPHLSLTLMDPQIIFWGQWLLSSRMAELTGKWEKMEDTEEKHAEAGLQMHTVRGLSTWKQTCWPCLEKEMTKENTRGKQETVKIFEKQLNQSQLKYNTH